MRLVQNVFPSLKSKHVKTATIGMLKAYAFLMAKSLVPTGTTVMRRVCAYLTMTLVMKGITVKMEFAYPTNALQGTSAIWKLASEKR